jgi:hypothetical protein
VIDWEARNKEKAEQFKNELLECQIWIEKVGWSTLPKGVRTMICYGEIKVEEMIKLYIDRSIKK